MPMPADDDDAEEQRQMPEVQEQRADDQPDQRAERARRFRRIAGAEAAGEERCRSVQFNCSQGVSGLSAVPVSKAR